MNVSTEGGAHPVGSRPAGGRSAQVLSAIRVNGTAISESEIAREIQYHSAGSLDEARHEAGLGLVVRELLLSEARRLGLGDSDSGAEKAGSEDAIERLLLQEIELPEADVTTCRRYYDQNKERFRSPDIFEASHILLPATRDDTQGRALARAKAYALLRELEAKPEDFAELARTNSACSSASDGGHLGQLTSGQTTPEFEAAVATLAPGEYTRQPVSTRYGYHIIKLHRRAKGRQLPFSLVKNSIVEHLRRRSWNQAVHQYISILAGRADIQGIDIDGAASPLVQ